ncbi:hypothetical protein VCSRO91_2840 [Vibrio cholerae]|nr:hypothetical protein VCSRO91_2840 [Vibrio cholerae]
MMNNFSRFQQFLLVYLVAGIIGVVFMADSMRFYADLLLSLIR